VRRKKVFGPEHLDTLYAEAKLGQQAFLASQFEAAQDMLEETVPLLRKVAGSEDRRTLNAISDLARCRAATGRTHEAVVLLTECAPKMRDDTFINLLLANLQLWLGHPEEYNKTRSWMIDYQRRGRGTFRDRADILERAVLISCLHPLENADQGKELLATLARCQEIRSVVGAPPDRGPGPSWRAMITGMVHYRTGDYAGAAEALEEWVRLQKNDIHDEPIVNLYRAMVLFQQGHLDAAKSLYRDTSTGIAPPPSQDQPLLGSQSPQGFPVTVWLTQREAQKMFGDSPMDISTKKSK